MWEMTPSSEAEIPGGISAGGKEGGLFICLLKEDRLPLLPTAQQLFRDLQVEGRGVTEIDNVVEKRSFAKGLWLPPAGVCQIPGRCSLLSPSDN